MEAPGLFSLDAARRSVSKYVADSSFNAASASETLVRYASIVDFRKKQRLSLPNQEGRAADLPPPGNVSFS